jgi:FdhD protein
MVSKAAFPGIEVIASRTSPTYLAVKICSERGITLIGYVRGTSFDVYCCPEKLSRAQAD